MSTIIGKRYEEDRSTINWGKDLITKTALCAAHEAWKTNPDKHSLSKFEKLFDAFWEEVSERMFGKSIDLTDHISKTQQRDLSANKLVQRGDKTNRYPREYPRNNPKMKDIYPTFKDKCADIIKKYTTGPVK